MQNYDWTWVVIYDDDSEHSEDELEGWLKVDVPRVTHLVVFHRNDESKQYVVSMQEGMRPIFFRRSRKTVDISGAQPQEGDPWVFATVLGWQKTVNGTNVQSLIWLLFDGSVAVTDRDIDELNL